MDLTSDNSIYNISINDFDIALSVQSNTGNQTVLDQFHRYANINMKLMESVWNEGLGFPEYTLK